jgi:hypothetical protein
MSASSYDVLFYIVISERLREKINSEVSLILQTVYILMRV